MFSCAPISMIIDTRIANAKLAANLSVKKEVCVRKPGPIDEVAIRKMAPHKTCFCFLVILPGLSSDSSYACLDIRRLRSFINYTFSYFTIFVKQSQNPLTNRLSQVLVGDFFKSLFVLFQPTFGNVFMIIFFICW